jgi:hypothetical protein
VFAGPPSVLTVAVLVPAHAALARVLAATIAAAALVQHQVRLLRGGPSAGAGGACLGRRARGSGAGHAAVAYTGRGGEGEARCW